MDFGPCFSVNRQIIQFSVFLKALHPFVKIQIVFILVLSRNGSMRSNTESLQNYSVNKR